MARTRRVRIGGRHPTPPSCIPFGLCMRPPFPSSSPPHAQSPPPRIGHAEKEEDACEGGRGPVEEGAAEVVRAPAWAERGAHEGLGAGPAQADGAQHGDGAQAAQEECAEGLCARGGAAGRDALSAAVGNKPRVVPADWWVVFRSSYAPAVAHSLGRWVARSVARSLGRQESRLGGRR